MVDNPVTGHVGWCWWALGMMGDADCAGGRMIRQLVAEAIALVVLFIGLYVLMLMGWVLT